MSAPDRREAALRHAGDALAWIPLLALVVFFPVLRGDSRVFGSSTSVRVLCALFEVAVILAILLSRGLRVPRFTGRPWIRRGILFWLVWSLAATLASDHLAAAFVRQSEWLLHIAFALAVWSALAERPNWGRLLLTAIVAGLVLYTGALLKLWNTHS